MVAALMLIPMLAACRSAATQSLSESASARSTLDASIASSADAAPTSTLSVDAGADRETAVLARSGFICMPPMSGDFERCPKGAMAGDDALRDCLRREAERPQKTPTFRVDAVSSTFSPTHWRCAEVSLDTKVHVTVDTLAGLDETVPSTCASHAIDMIGPNTYGAIFFRCSNRARSEDEILFLPR